MYAMPRYIHKYNEKRYTFIHTGDDNLKLEPATKSPKPMVNKVTKICLIIELFFFNETRVTYGSYSGYDKKYAVRQRRCCVAAVA
ncbi:hypothetical protein BpHYR1_009736 [Brachionus plicatilis]|uniref:Uncharacterized protein n=1 Tax=Brachionus plicatilis TaxID=10195 RepID=A0A3M7R4R0_BRAPC|nr:hypothetical protein BpHYR1_009736 [Brachionus plicatilis]